MLDRLFSASGARPPLRSYTRHLWQRRQFVTTYATARLTGMYATARLGQIWQVATPLLNAGVYYLIFGVLLGTKHSVPNYIAYLCTGVFVFNFTQSAVLPGRHSRDRRQPRPRDPVADGVRRPHEGR
jgi:teichoic acid transport system permease protein